MSNLSTLLDEVRRLDADSTAKLIAALYEHQSALESAKVRAENETRESLPDTIASLRETLGSDDSPSVDTLRGIAAMDIDELGKNSGIAIMTLAAATAEAVEATIKGLQLINAR